MGNQFALLRAHAKEGDSHKVRKSNVNSHDLSDPVTTIALVFGYCRKNGFLDYKVKVDDFINIINQYFIERNIKFNDDKNININAFAENEYYSRIIGSIAILNSQFIIATNYATHQMLSIHNPLIFQLYLFSKY